MKFISFNINGLRARPHQLEAIIEKLTVVREYKKPEKTKTESKEKTTTTKKKTTTKK